MALGGVFLLFLLLEWKTDPGSVAGVISSLVTGAEHLAMHDPGESLEEENVQNL